MSLDQAQIAEFFSRPIAVDGNALLRDPQRLGYRAAVDFFAAGGHQAVEQIPVGCGKSGLITLLPFGCAAGRVLVIAPNLQIRDQLVGAFTPGDPRCTYTRFAVMHDLTEGPYVAALDDQANRSDLDNSHVVVTNIHQLTDAGRWMADLAPDYFDLIIVDEGHHNAAPTWQGVFRKFPDAKIISLTATPFRADDQPVEGDVIYRYPIAEAMRKGFIKNIQSSNVAPSELLFSYHGEEKLHTLEEVMQLKENDWFSRGVALSERCNISIVDASIEWLRHLRETGHRKHQIVASACTVLHARTIRHLYEERGYEAREIHSNLSAEQKAKILAELENGTLDVIVQVTMLGEGFDHPPLSVAAIFRPYRSLNPYIQFVGRVMRANVQDAPGHTDNRGIIVSHVGLNLDQHWDDFKTLDGEDQAMVHDWLVAPTNPPQATGNSRPPLTPAMHVTHERVMDQFLGDQFLDVPTVDIPDRVLEILRANGIDPATAGLDRDTLETLTHLGQPAEPTGPVEQPVGPQARRIALRAGLNDKVKSIAFRICQVAGLAATSRKLSSKVGGATNDLAAVVMLTNRAVNERVGAPAGGRRELTLQELEQAHAELEAIADEVQADIIERLS